MPWTPQTRRCCSGHLATEQGVYRRVCALHPGGTLHAQHIQGWVGSCQADLSSCWGSGCWWNVCGQGLHRTAGWVVMHVHTRPLEVQDSWVGGVRWWHGPRVQSNPAPPLCATGMQRSLSSKSDLGFQEGVFIKIAR